MSDTIPPPPDYGEPWEYTSFRNCIRNRHNHTLELQDELRDRARQCVNACAGMADPAKEIQAMREKLEDKAITHLPLVQKLDAAERQLAACMVAMPVGNIRTHITTEAKHNKHATDHATNPGQWMQSLHHDSAHFIVNGIPACSNADNGAKIVPGMAWLPHDGCVRKCLRCMRHAENDKHSNQGSEI